MLVKADPMKLIYNLNSFLRTSSRYSIFILKMVLLQLRNFNIDQTEEKTG